MDKSQYLLEIEIDKLKRRKQQAPKDVIALADNCLTVAKQNHFADSVIECLLIKSHCCWYLDDFQNGLKYAREAFSSQNRLDNDDFLPEILHLQALHLWGDGKLFTAQQFWINALEKSALEDDIEIQIESLLGLGNVWQSIHEYQLASSTHELAVRVANNSRLVGLEMRARVIWARDLYLQNNFAEMLSVLDGAAELTEDYREDYLEAEIWNLRSLALIGLERLEDAHNASMQALSFGDSSQLARIKAQAHISLARLALQTGSVDEATQQLSSAESALNRVQNGELLAQIYYQQSQVAEQKEQFDAALNAFRRYRDHSIKLLREQTARESLDRAIGSKRQLEQRARKLINRIRGQYDYDPEKHLSNVVSETYWWEQLVLYKTQLKRSNHSVIVLYHSNTEHLDICTEIVHSMSTKNDLIARLSAERIAILLADKDEVAQSLFEAISQMLAIFPWQRKGLNDTLPQVSLHDILSFPFTLEQLEQQDEE